ncbi:hypothetical protein ACFWFI_06470 [Streptomyces sp. NPDC060209]|uniref:hypothetical protein n=1 Tax=Streptomyces sp. NPDC060209 TaxID=3347073 RepID=UPI0036691EB3
MDQVAETLAVHEMNMVSVLALVLGTQKGVAVVPPGVGHDLGAEVAVDNEADLGGEVGFALRASLSGLRVAFRPDYPLAVYDDLPGEAERLLLEAIDPTVTCPTHHVPPPDAVSFQSVVPRAAQRRNRGRHGFPATVIQESQLLLSKDAAIDNGGRRPPS